MKLLQSNMFAGNKLHCFKAMQVLGDATQIWGFKIAKALPDKLRALVSRGGPKFRAGGAMNPNYAMTNNMYILYFDQIYKPF